MRECFLITDRPSCCGRDAGNGGDCVALMTDSGAPVIPCIGLRPSVAARAVTFTNGMDRLTGSGQGSSDIRYNTDTDV